MGSDNAIAFSRRATIKKTRRVGHFQIEQMERRVLLASAIAAFHPQQAFPTGTNPLALAVADVNRDGKPDLIVANNTDGNVGVLLGDGTGSFFNQVTFASGPTPIAVAVADVNGDGKPDLIVANYGSASVSVLLGNGDGTFQNPQSFATGFGPIAVTTANVNGDGKPDILVANYSSGTVSVLDGNGDGTFQPQQTFAAGTHPISIATADLNRDGKPDIAVSNYTSSTVSVLLGTGGGSFSAPLTFTVGGHPRSVVVSDINGDGKPDMVVVNKTDGTASVLLGNGDGTFATQLTSNVGSSPNAVAIADVNGDGKEDLVVADGSRTYPGNVAVLLGNRNGTFQPAVNFATGANPYSVAVADLNDDGRLDIATVNERSNTASILLGDVPPTVLSINRTNPPGPITSDSNVTYTVTFNEPVTGVDPTDFSMALAGVTATTPIVVSGSGAVYAVTINDISGAGTLGLNLVDDGSIKDMAGNPLQPGGTASFQSQRTFAALFQPDCVAVSDVNGDGQQDLVVANFISYNANNWVSVLLGNGDGTFQTQQSFNTGRPSTIALADVNSDGKPDLIVANADTNTVGVLLGNGNGTFQPEQTFSTGLYPKSIAVADVNSDGKLDLVVANINGNSVSVLLGNGNGTFQPQETFATGEGPYSVSVSDVNRDGKPDLLIASINSNSVDVLLGNGNGTFQPMQTVTTGDLFPIHVVSADVNGDGIPDLVVGNFGPFGRSNIGILLGNGNGTFQRPQTYYTGSDPNCLAVADVNGDGKLDIIVTDTGSLNMVPGNTVAVLLGNGNGTFQNEKTFACGTTPRWVTVADLNGDGRPDLVVANYGIPFSIGTVSVLLGNSAGDFAGQVYTIVPLSDTITGTSGSDAITLMMDADIQHIDWTIGTTSGQLLINDPNGLTINCNDGNDTITLDYGNGDPLPNILHLNGTFTINGFQGTNPLAGTTMDIGRSTIFISYSSSDPIAAIQGYLQNGYNGGAWNGTPTASTGVITSAAAQANHTAGTNTTGIGYADSADGQGINTTSNTIELTYTLYGDANLDHQVNSADLQILLFNLNRPGSWDQGDFNYDAQVNSADLQALLFTLNTSLGSQATPMAVAATPATSSAPSSNSDPSPHLMPAINATGSTLSPGHHPQPARAAVRKRR